MTDIAATGRAVLDGIGAAIDAVDAQAVDAACAAIAGAGRVMVYGCGREGLMMRALAMRLHHLGLFVSVQGDMAAPPLGPGDLLVTSAGPGELSTVSALMHKAGATGASILFLTARPDTACATLATQVLEVPARTMASDADAGVASPMGSAYEGALFVLFEVMVADLAQRLGQAPAAMRARHTNME